MNTNAKQSVKCIDVLLVTIASGPQNRMFLKTLELILGAICNKGPSPSDMSDCGVQQTRTPAPSMSRAATMMVAIHPAPKLQNIFNSNQRHPLYLKAQLSTIPVHLLYEPFR